MTEGREDHFAYKKIKRYMKNFGVEGFSRGVTELIEQALYFFLRDITMNTIPFTKRDNRMRIKLDDIKNCLIFFYKDIYEKIPNEYKKI